MMHLEGRLWTQPSGIWDRSAPFAEIGFLPVAAYAAAEGVALLSAVPWLTVAKVVGVGLGVSQVVDMFSGSKSFDEGWDDAKQFDERMAIIHALWLKLNDRIAGSCKAFVNGPRIAEYRADRTRFQQFYATTGKVSSRVIGFRSPSAAEIGTAKEFWLGLLGWVKTAEQTCPGQIAPGLLDALGSAEEKGGGKGDKGVDWGFWLGAGMLTALGIAYFASKRAPVVVQAGGRSLRGLEGTPSEHKKRATELLSSMNMGSSCRLRAVNFGIAREAHAEALWSGDSRLIQTAGERLREREKELRTKCIEPLDVYGKYEKTDLFSPDIVGHRGRGPLLSTFHHDAYNASRRGLGTSMPVVQTGGVQGLEERVWVDMFAPAERKRERGFLLQNLRGNLESARDFAARRNTKWACYYLIDAVDDASVIFALDPTRDALKRKKQTKALAQKVCKGQVGSPSKAFELDVIRTTGRETSRVAAEDLEAWPTLALDNKAAYWAARGASVRRSKRRR